MTPDGNRRNVIKDNAMLQLIKADLSGTLTLFADYRPQLASDSLLLDIEKLERMEDRDYLFLVRREKSYLFPVSDVYLAESYAYLCWTAYRLFFEPKVDALYLHISSVTQDRPFGIVTVLDYDASARDVEKFAVGSQKKAAAHIRRLLRHYRTHVQIGSTMDFIKYLRKAGE